jgi:hypothetical protein
MFMIIMGSMLSGNLSMLKSDSDTNAFSESSTFDGSLKTYVANVT